MLEHFYKNCRILVFLCVILMSVFLQAQEQKNIQDIEKIYLHTDRSTYFMGEDLWYKAYNVRASNNLLFDNSNILYVELISADSKIIARNKTNLEMGLGHGDFQLQDSLGVKPGTYQLRAYTNWNRNFGEDFVFKKDIEIIDVFESHDKLKTLQKSTLETKAVKKEATTPNTLRVDFFPEGGSFLENVASVVGFKAVDSNGKPIEIKGEIYDSDNEFVIAFESVHDGMGKLQILPMEGKTYYAKIKSLFGEELDIKLPKILKKGYLLNFKTVKGRNIVSINTNQATLAQNPNPSLTLVCKAKGIQYLETTQTLTETTLSFELPKDKTPEGISQITLFDNNNKPQSERLIYIGKEHDLEVELETDKATYEPNEKAIINVSSKSKVGVPKSASFSLSVTDMNGVEDKDFGTNICSYFLMESDIRGEVHHPGYYFDVTNPKRLEHLDNLLLTQGWRDFVWKITPKANETINYKAEKGITISGRVKQLFADKPLVGNNLTLALMSKKNRNIFNTVTDSIGRFQFENLLFSGKTNMYLNTRDEKGKFRGEIVLDSIEESPIPVVLKKESIDVIPTKNLVTENVLKKFTAFGVKPENVLKEVVVTAPKKNSAVVLYGVPDYSYVPDEKAKEFISIYDVLDKVPGLLVIDTTVSIPGEGDKENASPLILIDGYPILEISQLLMVSPYEIEKIDVIRGGELAMLYILNSEVNGSAGAISIFTNRYKNLGKPNKNPLHSIKKEVEGFYTTRIFYSPDPEKPNPELDKIAAVRNTIYWNPYVHPDKTGNVTVNYYNTKVETKIKVALEGITGSGIPVVKNAFYTVKKQESLK
ncbi:Plug domain-containing protein [Flavobacterium commune]|nr:Plug domain-containing protein [Flavobacterium commune]